MKKIINESKEKIQEINNLIYKKNYEEAKKQIMEYKNYYGEDSYVLLSEGKLYRSLEEYDKEIQLLEPLLEVNPKNIGYILYELAVAYKINRNEKKALETFLLIENTNHKNKEFAYFEIACLYYKFCDYDSAQKYFTKVIYNNGCHQENSKLYLAKIEIQKENYDKAEKILNTVITKKEKNLTNLVLYYKAKIYKAKEQYKEAKELILKIIISYDKEFVAGYLELIQIYCKENNLEEATKCYEKIKNKIEWSPYVSYIIAEYKYKQGLLDESLELYKKSIQNHLFKQYDIALLEIGKILIIKKRYEEAEKYLKKIKYGKYNNSALKTLAIMEIQKENYNKAYEYFLQINPNCKYDSKILEKLKLSLLVNADIQSVLPQGKTYSEKQILNYNKDIAIEHIKEHKKIKKNITYFSENIDIEKLYDEVKPLLKKENIIDLDIFNKYKIQYKEIGIFNNKTVDEMIVVTKANSKDIITMYPINNSQEEIDTFESTPKTKIKRISQIEKFNMKYNRTNI